VKFEPKTDQEIEKLAKANLLPPGIYDFEVYSAEDTTSQKGNEMTALKLRIDGESDKIIPDWLVAIDNMAFKLKHFAETTGLIAEYDAGEMTAEMMRGRVGKAKVGIQPAKDGYAAKNKIVDYIKPVDVEKNAQVQSARAKDLDDEIPF
jgi:hypothetical protein